MKVLVFEWLTGGGLWQDRIGFDPTSSIQSQGRQMLKAIAEDFIDAGVDVLLPIDGRWADEFGCRMGIEQRLIWESDDLPLCLAELAEQVDHIMLIAPESGSCLLGCLGWLESFSGALISPDFPFANIASNKRTTVEHLVANGFPWVPSGVSLVDFQNGLAGELVPPVVLKPIDGAGSEEVQLIEDLAIGNQRISRSPENYWVEPFIDGFPVSVSVLCGPDRTQFLPPTQQLFDHQPFGHYIGAGYPMESSLALRATRLAEKAIQAMPPTRGYIGVDMVLSHRLEQEDCLIEINPRLTMSYLTLRKAVNDNLARLMLEIACD